MGASAHCAVTRRQALPLRGAGGLAEEPGSAVSSGEDVLSLQPPGNTWAPWEPAERCDLQELVGETVQAELVLNLSSHPWPRLFFTRLRGPASLTVQL